MEEEEFIGKNECIKEITDLADKVASIDNNVLITVKTSKGTKKLIGNSEYMKDVLNLTLRVSPTDSNVLITGETGTGKELIASIIHDESARSDGPFVAINCSTVPESVFENELFGHEKGAFTGADKTKLGLFEIANGGTIFFDEIADMPMNTQPKVLRAIQERKIRRLGGSKDININIRIISATNKNLWSEIKAGNFREDLYYRINVFCIHIPPLRMRDGDIDILAKYLAQKHKKSISQEALVKLRSHQWPGNIRELENVIESASVLTDNNIIIPKDLNFNEELEYFDLDPRPDIPIKELFKIIEKIRIKRLQIECKNNITQMSKKLPMDRGILTQRMKEYGLK